MLMMSFLYEGTVLLHLNLSARGEFLGLSIRRYFYSLCKERGGISLSQLDEG